jgi:hypothetical protein
VYELCSGALHGRHVITATGSCANCFYSSSSSSPSSSSLSATAMGGIDAFDASERCGARVLGSHDWVSGECVHCGATNGEADTHSDQDDPSANKVGILDGSERCQGRMFGVHMYDDDGECRHCPEVDQAAAAAASHAQPQSDPGVALAALCPGRFMQPHHTQKENGVYVCMYCGVVGKGVPQTQLGATQQNELFSDRCAASLGGQHSDHNASGVCDDCGSLLHNPESSGGEEFLVKLHASVLGSALQCPGTLGGRHDFE